MTDWNLVDIAAAVLLAGGAAYGYHRGLIRQLLSITGLIAAYAAAFVFYDNLAPALRTLIPWSAYEPAAKVEDWMQGLKLDVYLYNALAFALLLFGVKITFNVAGHLLDWLSRVPGLNAANRWTGAVLALVETAVLLVVAVHIAVYVPSEPLRSRLSDSLSARTILDYTPQAAAKLTELFARGGR